RGRSAVADASGLVQIRANAGADPLRRRERGFRQHQRKGAISQMTYQVWRPQALSDQCRALLDSVGKRLLRDEHRQAQRPLVTTASHHFLLQTSEQPGAIEKAGSRIAADLAQQALALLHPQVGRAELDGSLGARQKLERLERLAQ